jgi:aerobic-type carbon monoxide dehydrogenase small subunit (CoxS/CutS family)
VTPGPVLVTVTVNGVAHRREVEPRLLLSDFLRHELGLTGTHVGCEHGVCGACTIRLDGVPVRSCLMFAVQADGHAIATVEGLAPGPDSLSPLQQAFHEAHGLQCGFCTPGILMTVSAFLEEHAAPTEEEVRHALSAHLCRCTGYQGIVDAALLAAARLRGEG